MSLLYILCSISSKLLFIVFGLLLGVVAFSTSPKRKKTVCVFVVKHLLDRKLNKHKVWLVVLCCAKSVVSLLPDRQCRLSVKTLQNEEKNQLLAVLRWNF